MTAHCGCFCQIYVVAFSILGPSSVLSLYPVGAGCPGFPISNRSASLQPVWCLGRPCGFYPSSFRFLACPFQHKTQPHQFLGSWSACPPRAGPSLLLPSQSEVQLRQEPCQMHCSLAGCKAALTGTIQSVLGFTIWLQPGRCRHCWAPSAP